MNATTQGAKGTGQSWLARLTEEVDRVRYPYRVGLAVVGILASIYLTWLHYASGTPIACPEGGLVNCVAVITSPESTLLGIPVAAFGLLFFLVALGLVLWRRRTPTPTASELSLLWAIGGAVVVVVLVYTELFVVDRVCLWCSLTHVLALAIFALEVWPGPAPRGDSRAAARRQARRT